MSETLVGTSLCDTDYDRISVCTDKNWWGPVPHVPIGSRDPSYSFSTGMISFRSADANGDFRLITREE